MIFGYPWMKRYGILLDIINNSIIFFLRYCMYLGVLLFPIFLKQEKTKTIFKARKQDIFPNRILKKGSSR